MNEAQQPRECVFIGVPMHDQRMYGGTATAVMMPTEGKVDVTTMFGDGSSLSHNFNQLWSRALMLHDLGEVQYFAMIHSDIAPETFWLDKLLTEMKRVDADVISAVSPFRDGSKMTSTAVGKPGYPWAPVLRFFVQQCEQGFPPTFGQADIEVWLDKVEREGEAKDEWGEPITFEGDKSVYPLLINTGCMLIRLDRPWVKEQSDDGTLAFNWEVATRIVAEPASAHPSGAGIPEGTKTLYRSCFEPEDWKASRFWHKRGVRVFATTAVQLEHFGERKERNTIDYQRPLH